MKTFVQYGAGNIGRGFIGQLFSDAGYFVRFVDVNADVVEALNAKKRYPLNIVSNAGSNQVWVENVSGINGLDTDEVAKAIANCDLMATAVGVSVMPRIVPNIVAGIKKRMISDRENPLNIIICENLMDADKLLYGLINEQLNPTELEYFNEKVGLVTASVGRMVPVMAESSRRSDPLRLCVESYCELPVDKAAFKGEIPNVSHLCPFEPFEYYQKRKMFVHNMGHTLTAYLGHLLQYEYIWQAIDNPSIKTIVERAMSESAQALSKQFNVPLQDVKEHKNDLILRFGNAALGDTVRRVGRDTKRKLSPEDRFAGAIKFCEENSVVPAYIRIGIASALFFDFPDGNGTSEVLKILNQRGPDAVIKEICDIENGKEHIDVYYRQLKKDKKLEKLIGIAESLS